MNFSHELTIFLDVFCVFVYICVAYCFVRVGWIVFALVGLQVLTSLLLMLIAGAFFGIQAACSLGLGAACYVIPTALAVIFLKFLRPYPVMAGIGFIVSEGLKIVLALILLVTVVVLYKPLQFLPFFVGLLAASHVVFLFFLKVHRYGKCK